MFSGDSARPEESTRGLGLARFQIPGGSPRARIVL